ncbi:hypothetical protein QJQ45_007733, partial [Haematococcus lacustris]
ETREFLFDPDTQTGVGIDPGVTQAVSAASGVWDPQSGQLMADQLRRWKLTKGQVKHANALNNARRDTERWLAPIKPHLQHLAAASSAGTSLEANLKLITVTLATWDAVWEVYLDPKWSRQRLRLYGAEDRALDQFFNKLEEEVAEVSMERHGHARQVVVFFGAATIGTGGGWGADAVLRACCKVVCRPRGAAWSQERGQPVRGLMWCPVVAPRKPPQAPRSSQAATQPAASEPGPSTPPPAKRSKPAAEPTQPTKGKGKGKAAKAKPAPQPGRWLDRDCNAALNMQRIGESKWRPLELCYWPDQGALPAKGKEYPGLGYKRLRDQPPKAQQQQQQPAEAQGWIMDDFMHFVRYGWQYVFRDIVTVENGHLPIWKALVKAVLHYLTSEGDPQRSSDMTPEAEALYEARLKAGMDEGADAIHTYAYLLAEKDWLGGDVPIYLFSSNLHMLCCRDECRDERRDGCRDGRRDECRDDWRRDGRRDERRDECRDNGRRDECRDERRDGCRDGRRDECRDDWRRDGRRDQCRDECRDCGRRDECRDERRDGCRDGRRDGCRDDWRRDGRRDERRDECRDNGRRDECRDERKDECRDGRRDECRDEGRSGSCKPASVQAGKPASHEAARHTSQAKGKEYPGLGYKRLRDQPPKAQQQQQQPAEAQGWIMDDFMHFVRYGWQYVFRDIVTVENGHLPIWKALVKAVLHYLTSEGDPQRSSDMTPEAEALYEARLKAGMDEGADAIHTYAYLLAEKDWLGGDVPIYLFSSNLHMLCCRDECRDDWRRDGRRDERRDECRDNGRRDECRDERRDGCRDGRRDECRDDWRRDGRRDQCRDECRDCGRRDECRDERRDGCRDGRRDGCRDDWRRDGRRDERRDECRDNGRRDECRDERKDECRDGRRDECRDEGRVQGRMQGRVQGPTQGL